MTIDEVLDQINQKVTDQSTVVDSVKAAFDADMGLIAALKKEVADATAGTLSDDQQTKVNAAFDKFQANTQALTDAVVAGTVASDEPPAETDPTA